eukprot:snap_masked-scaffold_35-processed-gene-1.32-mRNA-1 protein AED:1.00 eAED:1.00 QI:0/0/0/0/1/1/2/0/64
MKKYRNGRKSRIKVGLSVFIFVYPLNYIVSVCLRNKRENRQNYPWVFFEIVPKYVLSLAIAGII